MSGPIERLQENITSATALLVIGLSIVAYGLSIPYAWVFFVVGLFVIVPLVGLLFGADDWRKWDPLSDEFWDDIFEDEPAEATESPPPDDEATTEDALETLRDRYARGELTDEQFERKLELLVETESLENVEDWYTNRERGDRLTERE
ncbi:SHOCT domain-containing protein [Natronosalvus vescus]|uniref:SHOCT domain-containing protein n=1 Tax=Natronosalvus vescus TaxID=2953881 RepID=UPI002090159E|nr:SHOCT domain-containing protein [Natronosalvus vescus]